MSYVKMPLNISLPRVKQHAVILWLLFPFPRYYHMHTPITAVTAVFPRYWYRVTV